MGIFFFFRKKLGQFLSLISLLLNPQAVLGIDFLCDLIEKKFSTLDLWVPNDGPTVTHSMTRAFDNCVGKARADANIP